MAHVPEDEQHQVALQVERVRLMLQDAFAGVQGKLCKTLTHADFVEMRTDLPLFLPETLQFLLPKILEELMRAHTNDDVNTENAEFVLMSLNVDAYISEETYDSTRRVFGEDSADRDREYAESSRMGRHESFALITQDQAKAVYQWLLLARNWGDFAAWSDDMEGALDYWRRRANTD